MTKTRQNITIALWTISILLLCGIIVYFDSRLNTCNGLIHLLRDLVLFLSLVLLALVFLIRQIYKIAVKTGNTQSRILASIVVLVATITAFQGKNAWQEIQTGSSVLKASIYADQLDMGRLELLNEKKYYALYGHIDWSCTCTGNYEITGDTLILSGNPFEKSGGILTEKYIMTDSALIPVKTKNRDMKRTGAMRIEKKAQP